MDRTPSAMAQELGVHPKTVRAFLRRTHPRRPDQLGEDWVVSDEMATEVRRHFADTPTVDGRRRPLLGVEEEWAEFANLAVEVVATGKTDVDAEERDYKIAIARRLARAMDSCIEGSEWQSELHAAITQQSNLVYHLNSARFRDVVAAEPEECRRQLIALWEGAGAPDSIVEFGAFLDSRDSQIGPAGVLEIASSLLLATGDAAPFKSEAIGRFLKYVGAEPLPARDIAGRWSQFQDLLDEAEVRLTDAGYISRDLLDVQSIVWVMSTRQVEALADGELARRIDAWRGESVTYERANRIDAGAENAAWEFLRAGLALEPSPLTGTASVWTLENAREVVRRVFDNPIGGTELSFQEKLARQLEGADAGVVQLIAEIQFIRQLATGGVGIRGASKSLQHLAAIADAPWKMPESLVEAFEGHVFGGGTRFNQDQWLHLVLTVRAIAAWREASESDREELLSDPWAFLDFLETVGGTQSGEKHMRMVLAYVAWPNYFHPIISSDHIGRIRWIYREFVPEPGGNRNADVQRDLFAIDRALVRRAPDGVVNFYRSPFVEEWLHDSAPDGVMVDEPDDRDFGQVARSAAGILHMDAEALERIGRVLQVRKQVVFYGPPGTGKTYVARVLAEVLGGDEADATTSLVQFHPSYSYEDFFEGFRPVAAGDGAGFALQAGPLRRLANQAEDDPDHPYFLIIDEMNRGNLAKVFGELYFLLEYRDKNVVLQYSPAKPFALPPNLYIIGTMNTTDRSIGLVDAAIRRRFAFIEFHPDASPVEGVLERFLDAESQTQRNAGLLSALNSRIHDRDLKFGPSYFMRPEAFDGQGLRDVWDFDILPLLFEHFHGRKDAAAVREEFALDLLLGEVTAEGD